MQKAETYLIGLALLSAGVVACNLKTADILKSNYLISDQKAAAAWQPTDFGFLFPFPKNGDIGFDNVFKLSEHATLMPLELYQSIGFEVPNRSPPFSPPDPVGEYEELFLSALRIDTCFKELGNTGDACRHRVRIAIQNIQWDASVQGSILVNVRDAAIHLTYELGDEAFKNMMATIQMLKVAEGSIEVQGDLAVPSSWIRQDLNGTDEAAKHRRKKFMEGLTKVCRQEALIEVTTMNLKSDLNGLSPEEPLTWVFKAYDMTGGTLEPRTLKFVSDNSTRQEVIIGPSHHLEDRPTLLFGFVRQHSTSPDAIEQLLGGEEVERPIPESTALVAKAYRLENPKFHDMTSVDCANCHIAPMLKRFFKKNGFEPTDASTFADQFVTSHFDTSKLIVNSALSDLILMHFGYIGVTSPVVSLAAAAGAVRSMEDFQVLMSEQE